MDGWHLLEVGSSTPVTRHTGRIRGRNTRTAPKLPQEFLDQARVDAALCRIEEVSFIEPVGAENEHPGYASATAGSTDLVELLGALEGGRCASDAMVIVIYDEFGGQRDHVTPPGQGGERGPADAMGPSARIPALVIHPGLRHGSSSTTRSTTRSRSSPPSSGRRSSRRWRHATPRCAICRARSARGPRT